MTEQIKAVTRDQAMDFADLEKFYFANAMKLGVPTICLACQHSAPIPNVCKDGQDITGEIYRKTNQSGFDEPIINICSHFISNTRAT